jgi:amino acid adenylation domain-containing protein
VAHWLRRNGVKPDARVGLCVERSVGLVVGMLGILKAGGAYVPLDPSHPPERLKHMLSDSAAVALLTQQALRGNELLQSARVPVMELESECLSAESQENLSLTAIGLAEHHLAYVLYTSGSTGLPKGVMVEHRGVMNYLMHVAEHYFCAQTQGALVATPLGFDATVTTLLGPWVTGRPTVLLPEEPQACLQELLKYCRRAEPWLFKLTPAHLDVLSGLMEQEAGLAAHRLVVGGEQLTRHCLQRFRQRVLPNAIVVNEYGPTETVVGCTTFTSTAAAALVGDAVPIGRPMGNVQIYILDEHLEPAPLGVRGEIYIAGAGVARGYLNREELTRERFVADPFNGGRMYKSGDVGRWLADGTIEYLGRNDAQVKIRGFRIELGEIEARLGACQGVRDAVVMVREDPPGEKSLVAYVSRTQRVLPDPHLAAYVVLQPRAHADAEALQRIQASVRRRLPRHMHPSAWVVIEQLPLTINGKVDIEALPVPDLQRGSSHVAPATATETHVQRLWQDVLGHSAPSVATDFFAAGGHSLLLTRLLLRVSEAFDIELSITELMQRRTIRDMASLIDGIVSLEQTAQPLAVEQLEEQEW